MLRIYSSGNGKRQTTLIQLESDLRAPFKRSEGEGREIQIDEV